MEDVEFRKVRLGHLLEDPQDPAGDRGLDFDGFIAYEGAFGRLGRIGGE